MKEETKVKSEKKKHEVIIPDMQQVEGEMQRLGLSPNSNILYGREPSEKLGAGVVDTVSHSSKNLWEKLRSLVKPKTEAEKAPGEGTRAEASEIPVFYYFPAPIPYCGTERLLTNPGWQNINFAGSVCYTLKFGIKNQILHKDYKKCQKFQKHQKGR